MSKTWKNNELAIAKAFGARRNPFSGSMSHQSQSDTLHEKFYIEIKDGRQSEPTVLWKDTVRKAKEENKIPMTVHHFKGEKLLDSRITLRLGDFLKLCRDTQNPPNLNEMFPEDIIPHEEGEKSKKNGGKK